MTMKYDAVAFSFAGDKYIGTSYEKLDCQAFVEKCMSEVGLYKDLGGSNSWYRECIRNGWVGTPEECVKKYGGAPKGALLFILEDVGPGTPGKFRDDGIGDATHMGIVTQRNEGAIHSSKSRGGVVTSKFKDRTIPGGGWNRVGLLNYFNYGNTVKWVNEHEGTGTEKEGKPMKQIVVSDNGNPVNLRAKKDTQSARLAKVPVGEEVEVFGTEGLWSRVRWNGITGWMMTEYLVTDDSGIPGEDPDEFTPADADEDEQDGSDRVFLEVTVEEAAALLPVLEKMTEQILNKVGRG